MSLQLVDRRGHKFLHVLCNYLITPEERPIVHFPSYLEKKILASEGTF